MAVPKLNTLHLEAEIPFRVQAPFMPMGDQPAAIEDLAGGIENGQTAQVLLGATGTGKTLRLQRLSKKYKSRRWSLRIIKPWQRSSPVSLRSFFRTMRLNTLSVIMIIISRRLI